MSISNNFTIYVPNEKTLKETFLENRKLLFIGTGMFVLGTTFGMPIGAFIYHLLTNAALASCPSLQETIPWKWDTSTLT